MIVTSATSQNWGRKQKKKKTLAVQGLCQFSFSFHQVQGVNNKKKIETLQLSIYLSN
jgi:hypothetical protein